MDRLQYLFSKLGEEAAELGQIALKGQQFGPDEYYAKLQPQRSNMERMHGEFNDVLAVIEVINNELEPEGTHIVRDQALIDAKKKKIEKYFRYSQECGMTDKE